MTHLRPFNNADSAALTALWNRGVPDSVLARPLKVQEFDAHVIGSPVFDPAGLIVAECDGKPIAYVHAGFGPETQSGPPLVISHKMGTVAMLVEEPASTNSELEKALLTESVQYLRGKGSEVIYAGGQYPLNPFYWGIYGGSEWAGILGAHTAFHRAVSNFGFEPVSKTVLLEADLSTSEARDARGVLMRRQTRLDITEDALPRDWWESLAIGDFRPTAYRLIAKADDAELARALTWDMTWFSRRDSLSRVGLIDLEVHPEHRRKGYGRHLVNEILKLNRAQSAAAVALQTRSTNAAALALYQSLGFQPVESTTLYRLPGSNSNKTI